MISAVLHFVFVNHEVAAFGIRLFSLLHVVNSVADAWHVREENYVKFLALFSYNLAWHFLAFFVKHGDVFCVVGEFDVRFNSVLAPCGNRVVDNDCALLAPRSVKFVCDCADCGFILVFELRERHKVVVPTVVVHKHSRSAGYVVVELVSNHALPRGVNRLFRVFK